MTDQEAIKIHIEECNHGAGVINEFLKTHKDVDSEDIGECEENIVILKTAITALEEIQQYRAIGTVEECREATEKQRAKMPLAIVKSNIENGGMYGDCPRCGEHMESLWTAEKFCPKCGQHIDWSE